MLPDADLLLTDRTKAESFLIEISKASNQHIPDACEEARKIEYEPGKGCTTAPILSFSGPRGAQID